MRQNFSKTHNYNKYRLCITDCPKSYFSFAAGALYFNFKDCTRTFPLEASTAGQKIASHSASHLAASILLRSSLSFDHISH